MGEAQPEPALPQSEWAGSNGGSVGWRPGEPAPELHVPAKRVITQEGQHALDRLTRKVLSDAERAYEDQHDDENETGGASVVDPKRGREVPDGTSRPRRTAKVTWASEIKMEIAKMLDRHIPLGELTIAAGREGTGKSSFGIAIAAGVTRGTLPGALFGQPRRVLYLAKEDSWAHTLAPRLKAAGADMAMIGRVDVTLEGDERRPDSLNLPADTPMLEALIREHEIALVVFDPIVSAMGAEQDGNKQKDTRATYEPLVEVAHRRKVSVLGIAHFNKGKSDPASMISGSHALKDLARSIVVFAHDTTAADGERVLQQVKNSVGKVDEQPHTYRIDSRVVQTADGPADVGLFLLTGEVSERTVVEVMAGNERAVDSAGDDDEVAEWLRGVLAERPGCEASAKELQKLARDAGHSFDQVKRAKKRIPGYRVRSKAGPGGPAKTGWFWVLEPVEDVEARA